ncbi:MAG TPA: type II CAAX endopeptidase family protein [Ignavibacteriaceae bacterium]|jgi:membrane protease YdiL (CAAX protease family)|nr:type II CAAX endopeptidase family protein [Ignavibacteriaceae bacterium]
MDDFNSQHPLNEDPDKKEEQEKTSGGIQPQISPIAAAFIGLIGGFILYQVVGGVITLLIFGMNIDSAPVNGVRLMTMAGQILFMLLPALLFSKWFYVDISSVIRTRIPSWKEFALFGIGIIILTPLLQYFITVQTYLIDIWAANSQFINSIKSALDSLNDLVEKTYGNLLAAKNLFEALLVITVVAVVPAVCEETMFRGFIQKSFELRIKPVWAALITAVFFGIYHFNPYGMIPLIILGFYFGFAAYMSNSILIPMSLHFTNNFIAIMVYFLIGNEDLINSTPDSNVDLNSAVLMIVLLSIMMIGLIITIRKFYSKQIIT